MNKHKTWTAQVSPDVRSGRIFEWSLSIPNGENDLFTYKPPQYPLLAIESEQLTVTTASHFIQVVAHVKSGDPVTYRELVFREVI